MNQRGIPTNEMKHIAHVIAEKSIVALSEQPITAVKKYLETYNDVIDYIEDYNIKITSR